MSSSFGLKEWHLKLRASRPDGYLCVRPSLRPFLRMLKRFVQERRGYVCLRMFFSGPSLTPSHCLSVSLPLSMCQHLQARPFVTGGAGRTAEEEDVCVTVSDPIAKLCGRRRGIIAHPPRFGLGTRMSAHCGGCVCSQSSTEAQK